MDEKITIILDCYADWCKPCQELTPILEKLTREYNGKFKLIKLNIDKLPDIA
jgi:putative thioredoxin